MNGHALRFRRPRSDDLPKEPLDRRTKFGLAMSGLAVALGITYFMIRKPAEEKIIHPVVAALASTATCVSVSPDNKLVVVEHRTSATGGYMFLNGQTIEATPETGTPNIRVSIGPNNSPGAQRKFRVSYQDEGGKTGSAEAIVPECSR